ncbi:MAG: hypothetical protein AB9907_06130 [Flexilinea sp.]
MAGDMLRVMDLNQVRHPGRGNQPRSLPMETSAGCSSPSSRGGYQARSLPRVTSTGCSSRSSIRGIRRSCSGRLTPAGCGWAGDMLRVMDLNQVGHPGAGIRRGHCPG